MADDAGAGTDLDVWAGTPQAGRKLTTVRFGTQSPSFAPVANQYSQGRKVGATTVYGYQLSFLVAGTTPASVDTQQQEDAYPGDEVLIVVTSLEGASGEARYNLHVYFPKIGALRASEGDTGPAGLFSGIQAPQGKRLVILDASGLVGLADGTSGQATTYDVGDGTGCAEEINRSDQPGPGPGTRTTIGRGSFADFAYALPAASTKADIYASPGPCTGQPAASADLTHDAGSNVLALLYGPPHALRTMVLPE